MDTALAPIPLRAVPDQRRRRDTPGRRSARRLPERSTIAEGPASLLQVTAVVVRPLAARCFSTSFWPCMTISGK